VTIKVVHGILDMLAQQTPLFRRQMAIGTPLIVEIGAIAAPSIGILGLFGFERMKVRIGPRMRFRPMTPGPLAGPRHLCLRSRRRRQKRVRSHERQCAPRAHQQPCLNVLHPFLVSCVARQPATSVIEES
jgi:hypothetical protein